MIKKDLIEKWKKRPYSWSQHCSFRDYDKEEWYQSYVMGIRKPSNRRMDFGSMVGKKIEVDPTYIPELPRGEHMEYKLEVRMGDTDLIGLIDSYFPEVHEYKTSGEGGWNQEKVDSHDQITMYALLLMLKEKRAPEFIQFYLHHMHTCEGGDFAISFCKPFTIDTYRTTRTTKQCLMFGAEIVRIRKEMEAFIRDHD